MQSLAITSLIYLSSFVSRALSLPQDTTSLARDTDSVVPLINCLSGTDHTLGTSCHNNAGSFACSGADRSHVVCTFHAAYRCFRSHLSSPNSVPKHACLPTVTHTKNIAANLWEQCPLGGLCHLPEWHGMPQLWLRSWLLRMGSMNGHAWSTGSRDLGGDSRRTLLKVSLAMIVEETRP